MLDMVIFVGKVQYGMMVDHGRVRYMKLSTAVVKYGLVTYNEH